MPQKQSRSLPLIGAQLIRLRFFGNGKDSEVTIMTEGHRKAVIPLSFARMDLTLSGPINVTCKGWDDISIIWEIVPTPTQSIRITNIAIDFPGSSDEWEEALGSYERTGTFDWAVDLQLELISTERKDAGARMAHPQSSP